MDEVFFPQHRRLDDEVPFDRSEMDVASDTDARDQGEVNGNAGKSKEYRIHSLN